MLCEAASFRYAVREALLDRRRISTRSGRAHLVLEVFWGERVESSPTWPRDAELRDE